jgi:HD superfamily phosphohydrolase
VDCLTDDVCIGIEFKGVQAAEGFVLSRDRMYWAVYFHKTTRGVEKLVSAILRRAKDLEGEGRDVGLGESMSTLLSEGEMGVEDFQEFDDTALFAQLKQWTRSPDSVLSDLCNRFFGRRLLKAEAVSPQQVAQALEKKDEIQQALEGQGLDFRYYFAIDDPSMSPYEPGGPNDEGSKIIVEAAPSSGSAGHITEISRFSRIIRLLREERKTELRVYSTAEGIRTIMNLLT